VRHEVARIALDNCGIDPERFRVEWVSSAEAPRFAEVVTRFIEDVQALGPNPLREKKTEAA
jgi:F420-non-reducing hydrogenase iron-sulfur subunit